jgi:four helix bundle protein
MKEYKNKEEENIEDFSFAMEDGKKFDLEERLIGFSIKIIKVTESLPQSRVGNHLAGQLIRGGTSPALNYGEAQSAESRNDFIHKMKICLKELRESFISLKIILRADLLKDKVELNDALKECNELISIFVKSLATAKANKIT